MTHQKKEKNLTGVTDEMERIANRMMSERLVPKFKSVVDEFGDELIVQKRDRSTNWNADPNEGANRKKQPWMFGEGLGNNLGLDGPKYMRTNVEVIPDATEEEKKLRRQLGAEKAKVTRAKNKRIKDRKRALEQQGELLVGQRIFRCKFSFDDWDRRAEVFGGLPEGVDVAGTDFGTLLLIDVIEESDGKKLGLECPLKDPGGRRFFLPVSEREKIDSIFGRVEWERPLTEREARQFGVDF